ncbi:unnamed protein product [Penicillium camemberti]|uniref:Str. FM013 n=1 Tax=Penicillium camemberti (strain FM 013) TaxID=1429867 RepID=A0A0G4PWA5_PENC3|nr:unnamed protein product [Penicillium camemberti]
MNWSRRLKGLPNCLWPEISSAWLQGPPPLHSEPSGETGEVELTILVLSCGSLVRRGGDRV